MKKLLFYFIILLLAISLGLYLHATPGYVLISLGHMQIETTFWAAVILLLIAFWLLYLIVRLLQGSYRLPSRYRNWRQQRIQKKSQQYTQQGFSALYQEKWDQAEKDFLKATRRGDEKLINYLGLAQSAHLQKNFTLRDEYVARARQSVDSGQIFALDMAQARWQLESEQWSEALESLLRLQAIAPHHPAILKGLQEVYYAQENWEQLRKLLPKLRQYHVLDNATLTRLEREVFYALLSQAEKTRQYELLEKTWGDLPKAMHQEPMLLSAYVGYLIRQNQQEKAEKLLKVRLRKSLDPQLLELYSRIVSPKPARQLARAELWLKKYPRDPALLLCLGQLCMRFHLWGKARSYLETCLRQENRSDVQKLLDQVLEQLRKK
jgi:HemY protein